MKMWAPFFALALLTSGRLLSQPVVAYPAHTPEQIDELISPIALYPDPLVSVILPASTVWPDVQSADRFLRGNVDPATIEVQPWDESVKALTQYPQVVAWMVDNLAWTQNVGATFIEQPAEVMNSIQRLRASARAAGILVDTPQQRVVVQGSYISIEPAQLEIVYVPIYDPEIIYVPRGRPLRRGTVTFSAGFTIGTRSTYAFDWNRRAIWIDRGRRDFSRAPATTVVVRPEREEWHPRREIVARVRAARPPATVQIVRPRAFPTVPVPEARVSAPVQQREERLTPTGRIPDERPREVINRSREVVPTPPAPTHVEPRTIPPKREEREVRQRVEAVPSPVPPVPVPEVPAPQVSGVPAQPSGRVPAPPAPPETRPAERRRENPPSGKGKSEARQVEQQPQQPQPPPPRRDQDKDDDRGREGPKS